MARPLLFDMDGVVLEGPRTDPRVYADATAAALDELGADASDRNLQALDGADTGAVVERCEVLGIDPDRFWALRDRFASRGTRERLLNGEREPYDDAAVLRDLADRTTTALVTNNRHATAEFVADHFSFGFDAVRGRDPTLEGFDRRKPDPHYLEATLAELGVDSGVYVGDSPTDVTAGAAAGLETAFLRRPHNRGLERPPGAAHEVDSLEALLEFV